MINTHTHTHELCEGLSLSTLTHTSHTSSTRTHQYDNQYDDIGTEICQLEEELGFGRKDPSTNTSGQEAGAAGTMNGMFIGKQADAGDVLMTASPLHTQTHT